MTVEELIAIFNEDSGRGCWVGDNAYQGLQIISKYTNSLIVAAEHDIIYSEGIEQLINKGITKEDCIALNKLHWHIECDCLACFV